MSIPVNRTREILKAGGTVTGPIISEARTPAVVKGMAAAGHDFLFIDMEHAMFDWETIHWLCQAALLADITPLVRATDLAYPLVSRALDAGAQGIIIPRVETREQVEAAVSYAKYPPYGRRGAGGEGRHGYAQTDVKTAVNRLNEETMVVVQIESQAGLDNLDAMASVPGVDVMCVGPQDLSISLNMHGQYGDSRFMDILAHISATCDKYGVATGMVEREAASHQRWVDRGYRMLICNTDSNMMFQSAARDVAALRQIAPR